MSYYAMLPKELDEEVEKFRGGHIRVESEYLPKHDYFILTVTIREQGGTYIFRNNASRREIERFPVQRVLNDWVLERDGTIKIYRAVELIAVLSPETSKILLNKFKRLVA